ncbi:hypothetical protein M5689_015809 [Euphorbia peplus]|nr:hypothetical protein M5689_015809 [Euphorbia peplus]
MEKYFGNAYRGDPGVPHADPDRFWNIWIGSAAFSTITFFNPYLWQLSNQFNWHDKAFLFEQYHWKKALKKNEPYKFKWNQMDKEVRDSYYFNWPVSSCIGISNTLDLWLKCFSQKSSCYGCLQGFGLPFYTSCANPVLSL